MIYKENSMFTLTGSGIRNILFDARLRNSAQLPAQFASEKAHNFHFYSHTLSEGLHFEFLDSAVVASIIHWHT